MSSFPNPRPWRSLLMVTEQMNESHGEKCPRRSSRRLLILIPKYHQGLWRLFKIEGESAVMLAHPFIYRP